MMSKQSYIKAVFEIAAKHGHHIERSRNGLLQIVFTNNKGNKKLHEEHLEKLYPEILQPGVNVSKLIAEHVRNRSCVHVGMTRIIAEIAGN